MGLCGFVGGFSHGISRIFGCGDGLREVTSKVIHVGVTTGMFNLLRSISRIEHTRGYFNI